MIRLDRLLFFPSSVRATSAPGSRHRLLDHPLVALGFLLALCLVSASLLSLARPSSSRTHLLEGIGKVAFGAWPQAMTWSMASNTTAAGVAAVGPKDSLLDFTIILAVLLGAATSYVFNYAWAAIRERRSGRSNGSGVTPQAEGGSGGVGAQAFDNIPDNACYFCIRRAATSKCGSCRCVVAPAKHGKTSARSMQGRLVARLEALKLPGIGYGSGVAPALRFPVQALSFGYPALRALKACQEDEG